MTNGVPMTNYEQLSVAPIRKYPGGQPQEPEWKKGFAAAVDEEQALWGGMAGAVGQAGVEALPKIAQPYARDLRDWGTKTFTEQMEESTAGWQKPKVARIEDINLFEEGGVGRLSDYAQYTGAKGLGQIAALALAGGPVGALAKLGMKKSVKHLAKRHLTKLAGKEIPEGVEKAYRSKAKAELRRAGKEVTEERIEEIGEKALAQVRRRTTQGAIGGAGAAAFGVETGGAFGQQVTEEEIAPEDALLPSFGVGAINAALELVAPVQVAKKLGLGLWAKKGVADQFKKDPVGLGKKAQKLAGKILKGATTTAAQEGITEGIQELVQLAGVRFAKDEELFAELSPEDRSQFWNAMAAGGLTGMLFGGGAGPFMQQGAKAPAREEIVRELAPEVQAQVTDETVISLPRQGETRETYIARISQEVVDEAAKKAAPKAGEEAARAERAGELGFQEGVGEVVQEGLPGEPISPQPGLAVEARILELRKQLETETDPAARSVYEIELTNLEAKRDAETVREDQGGLPEEGRVREGVQDERREGGEFVAEEGRARSGEVSPEDQLGRPTEVEAPVIETLTRADGNPYTSRERAVRSIETRRKKGELEDAVTRKTEDGWVIDRLESRGQAVEKTVQQVRDETSKELGRGWIKRAENLGIFEIRDEVGPTGRSAEYNPKTGKITVYAKSLTEGSSAAQALHETSHASMEMLTQGRLGKFVQEIVGQAKGKKDSLAAKATRSAEIAQTTWLAQKLELNPKLYVDSMSQEELQVEYERLKVEVPKSLAAKSDKESAQLKAEASEIFTEETFAYFVQYAYDTKRGSGLFRRAINSVKAGWLTSEVGQKLDKAGLAPKMSDGLAVELARRSARYTVEMQEEMSRLLQEPTAKEVEGRAIVEEGEESILESSVWHSGPNQWLPEPGFPYGRPRLDKVQSGEGGQLFGWGFYSAENEAVSGPEGVYAKSFARASSPRFEYNGKEYDVFQEEVLTIPELMAARYLFTEEFVTAAKKTLVARLKDRKQKLRELNRMEKERKPVQIAKKRVEQTIETLTEAINLLPTVERRGVKDATKAFTTHLEIPDADISRMIQWETLLGEQPEGVQKALQTPRLRRALEALDEQAAMAGENPTGETLYKFLAERLPLVENEHPYKKVSEYLESLGIVGNKYLDWGSRPSATKRQPLVLKSGKSGYYVQQERLGDMWQVFDSSGNIIQSGFKQEGAISLAEGVLNDEVLEVQEPVQTFNYVIWDQGVLDRIAHLNPQTGEPLLGQIDQALHSDKSALKRTSEALEISRKVEDNTLASHPQSFSSAWLTDPLSNISEEVNNPGFFNKLKVEYVEKFSDLWQLSKKAAAKFNLAKSKRTSEQKNFEASFIKPWIDIVKKLSTEMSKGGKEFTVEDGNNSFAAQHIVEDNVNELMAQKGAKEGAARLEEALVEYEKLLEKDDPVRAEIRQVRLELTKGQWNLANNLTWEGELPVTNDGVTPRVLTKAEKKARLKKEVDRAYDSVVGETKIWKLSPIEELRMDWEGLKHHGAGFATPETMSTDPEVQAAFNAKLDLIGRPENAHEIYGRVKDNATFQSLALRAREIAHMSREQLVRGELITREEADAMAQEYKYWVPLRRKDYDFQKAVDVQFGGPRDSDSGVQLRAGTSKVNPPVHSMQNLMASYDAAVTAAEANIARSFLAQQIEANPTHWAGWFKVKKDSAHKKSYDKDGFVQTRMVGGTPEDIPFFRNGERYYIEVEKENQRALTLSVAIRNLDSQELGPVFNVMNKVNSWIRWVNVSGSPAFLLMNAPRDYFTARLNLKATEIADHGKEVRKEVRSSAKALWKHFMKGEKNDEILAWEQAGGRISFVESLRPNDETWGSLEAKIRHRQGQFNFGPGMEANFGPGVGEAVGKARDFLERIETINIIAENVMRFSAWKVAKKQGLSDDKAAMISKDITTNFDRKGLRAQTLGTYWLFYNATVQGNTQVLRNIFYGPNKQKLWGALGAVMAMAALNDQLGALLSDDEDNDGRSDWDSTQDWKKEKFARIAGSNIFWPGEESTFATFPLPWVFNTVWRFGEMLSEAARGKKDLTEIPADMAGLMLNTFNPISGTDTTLAQMVAPTAADPLVQIWENTDAFGRPLGPTRFPGQEDVPDAKLSWLNEPKGYKWLAREVNQITGGSAAEQGGIDWRPSTYRVLADTLMGGGGRFFKQLLTSAATPITGTLPEVKEAPGLRTFFFAPGDPIEAQLFHERVAKIAQAKKVESTFRLGPDRDLMELQRVRSEYAGELRMVSMAKDVERQIRDLRKQLRLAQTREQEGRVEHLKKKIERAQTRFNKSWAQRVGN